MGRKRRLITDSFPKVKRREGGSGAGKADRPAEPELRGEETLPDHVDKTHLEILRQFDLAHQFGPCTGITRLQRWERAEQLGLDPPHQVLKVLLAHPGNPEYQCSLWHMYPI